MQDLWANERDLSELMEKLLHFQLLQESTVWDGHTNKNDVHLQFSDVPFMENLMKQPQAIIDRLCIRMESKSYVGTPL